MGLRLESDLERWNMLQDRSRELSWDKAEKRTLEPSPSRKFNKIPQKTIVDSEKLQNYKIHQRNEKELLYLARGEREQELGA